MVRSEDNNLFGMAKSTLEESIVLFEVAICSAATIARSSSSSPFAAKLTKQRFDIFFDLGGILLSRLFIFRDAFNARGKEREKEEEEEEEFIVIVDRWSLQIKERERERDCFLCCLYVCRRTETRALQKITNLYFVFSALFFRFFAQLGETAHKEELVEIACSFCAQVAFFLRKGSKIRLRYEEHRA